MNTLLIAVRVIQVLSALIIIGLVLLQHGKGADMGAAFGSGASGSLFGATGSSNFLSKSTGFAAAVFFAATLALAFFGTSHSTVSGGVMENLPAASAPAAPAKPSASVSQVPAPAAPASAPVSAASAPAASTTGDVNQIPK